MGIVIVIVLLGVCAVDYLLMVASSRYSRLEEEEMREHCEDRSD